MQPIFEGQAFFMGMAALFLLISILCRFSMGMLLKRLVREAENMSATQNGLLRQCRLKFINCYELNGGVMNVEVFVEKFLQGLRLGKWSLKTAGIFCTQLMFFSMFADGIAVCLGIVQEAGMENILVCYLQAFLSLYLYFSVSGLIDVSGRRAALKTTVVDFLENRLQDRLENAKRDSAYLEAEEKKAEGSLETAARGKYSAAVLDGAGASVRERTETALFGQERTEAALPGQGRTETALFGQGSAEAVPSMRDSSVQKPGSSKENELEELLQEFLA